MSEDETTVLFTGGDDPEGESLPESTIDWGQDNWQEPQPQIEDVWPETHPEPQAEPERDAAPRQPGEHTQILFGERSDDPTSLQADEPTSLQAGEPGEPIPSQVQDVPQQQAVPVPQQQAIPAPQQQAVPVPQQQAVPAPQAPVSAQPPAQPQFSPNAQQYYTPAPPAKKGPSGAIIAIAVVAVAAAIGVAIGFGAVSSSSSGSTASTSTSASTSASSSASASSAAAAEAGQSAKASLADYSWKELATIADEISKSGSEDKALQIAKQYNLLDESGTLDADNMKSVEIGGEQHNVNIVGFYHDDLASGGKAGITFAFTEAVEDLPMNNDVATNVGGWKTSDMRSWLNTEFEAMLPDDLRDNLKEVSKPTNNVGETTDINCISYTNDLVWLFSASELSGTCRWAETVFINDSDNDAAEAAAYEDIMNSEGAQYMLFKQQKVLIRKANPSLYLTWAGRPCDWWLRSPSPGKQWFRLVTENGELNVASNDISQATAYHGVVPGFCL